MDKKNLNIFIIALTFLLATNLLTAMASSGLECHSASRMSLGRITVKPLMCSGPKMMSPGIAVGHKCTKNHDVNHCKVRAPFPLGPATTQLYVLPSSSTHTDEYHSMAAIEVASIQKNVLLNRISLERSVDTFIQFEPIYLTNLSLLI